MKKYLGPWEKILFQHFGSYMPIPPTKYSVRKILGAKEYFGYILINDNIDWIGRKYSFGYKKFWTLKSAQSYADKSSVVDYPHLYGYISSETKKVFLTKEQFDKLSILL